MEKEKKKKVIFCTPSLEGPTAPYIQSLEASISLIIAAGWEEGYAQEVGCPYISHARASMTRKALTAGADVIVYLDYDLSWEPEMLLKLLETEGDVVAATYRYKKDEEEYMGAWRCDSSGFPVLTKDNENIDGFRVPAGFMKVTRDAIRTMMKAYPELQYGDPETPSFDLFNHGAYKGVWYGEDMAFSRRWIDLRQSIVLVPDIYLNHHAKNGKVYSGSLHNFLISRKEV